MSARDNFSKPVKKQLADRVRHACSNPGCGVPTMGPDSSGEKSINIGVAAHITAAAPGGKRFDLTLNATQRKSISNGIWLCQSCSKLIDSDERLFPTKKLRNWKNIAEQKCLEAIVSPTLRRPSVSRAEYSVDLGYVKQLGLPDNIDLHALSIQMTDAAKADILAFKNTPSWPCDPIALDLKITGDQDSQRFDVLGLTVAIETFNEISVIASPGTGKTTTLIQLTDALLEENISVAVFIPLSEWSTLNTSFLECITKRKAFQGSTLQDLMLLAHHGRLILILDGWNELDFASRRRSISDIKQLQRDFPDIRIVISSRQKEIDIPIFGPEVEIGSLSEEQQLSIAKMLRGSEGEALMDHVWRTRGVRELVATPLYLMTLLSQTQGEILPTTKEEVLRMFVVRHESDAEKALLLKDAFEGCHREVLTAIAVDAEHAATTSVLDTRARTILGEVEKKLKDTGQIKEFPKPVDAIDLLVNLHTIVRQGGDKGSLSFQHHQFQEWYASFKAEELMIAAESGEKAALKALREDILNVFVWEEAILFACERLSCESQKGVETVAFVVLETMTIDPILSAEIIYRSSDKVWGLTKKKVIIFADKWHVVGKIDRAIQFMVDTGRGEFSSYIWPLISAEDNQIHIFEFCAGNRFRPNVLGSDLPNSISKLSEEKRKHLISDIARHSGMDGIELATQLALADESPEVKSAVIEALQFRRADRFVSEILRTAPDEVWSGLAKNGYTGEITDPEASERMVKEKEKLLAKVSDPRQKIYALLNSGVCSSKVGQRIGALIEKINFSDKQDNDRSMLHSSHEIYPKAVYNALIKQLESGHEIPFGSEVFLQATGLAVDDGPLVKLVTQTENREREREAAASIVGPKTIGVLIDMIAETNAQMKAAKGPTDVVLSNTYYGLERIISRTEVSSFIEAINERPLTKDVREVALLADLLAQHGVAVDKEPLKLNSEIHQHAVSTFQNLAKILLDSNEATRAMFAEMTRAIERLASPQLVPVLQKLLSEDLIRKELAKKEYVEALERGYRIENDARMSWNLQYRRAFTPIGGGQVIGLMKSYLPDPDFGFDAACVLKSIWDYGQPSSEDRRFLKPSPDFSPVRDQRIKRQSQGANIETAMFVDDILAVIDDLMHPGNGETAYKQALQLAKVAFSMPYDDKSEVIDRLLSLPLPAINKQDLLSVLVLAGETISAKLLFNGINDLLEEAKEKIWMLDEQDAWRLNDWLRLLPFSDQPKSVLGVLKKLDARHREPWNLRDLLSALGHTPSVGSEKILEQLAQEDVRFLSEYDWLAALTTSNTISAAQILLGLICNGSFLDIRGRADTSDLGRRLADFMILYDEFRVEVYNKYQDLKAGKAKATIEYAIDGAADIDGIMLLVKDAASQDKSFQQTGIYSALRNVLIGVRKSVKWTGLQESYSLPAPDLRKKLFEMVVNGNPSETQLASECLTIIDDIRDNYGLAESEPRHPDIESGMPWPQIN